MTSPESDILRRQLRQIDSRIDEQALEMTLLRTALDIQFKRIAEIQAELDLMAHARRHRSTDPLLARVHVHRPTGTVPARASAFPHAESFSPQGYDRVHARRSQAGH